MKKIFLLFICLFFLAQLSRSQTPPQTASAPALTAEQTASLNEIQSSNAQLIKLYGEKKFDEALVIGKSILETAVKTNLTNDFRVLPAIWNVAEIYLAKGKESEALNTFQIAADGYEKLGEKGKNALEKVLDRMAAVYLSKNDLKKAEAQYLKLTGLRESLFGAKSRPVAAADFHLANIYQQQRKSDKAELYYLKTIEINDAVLNAQEKDDRIDLDAYRCFCYHRAFLQNDLRSAMTLLEELDKKRGISKDDNLNRGIVNGKAIELVKPVYPLKAKQDRATGFAIVNIEISKQGNVTKARATCGFLEFVKETEAAAMKSRFSPTLQNGLPVTVTGYIVYNFTGSL